MAVKRTIGGDDAGVVARSGGGAGTGDFAGVGVAAVTQAPIPDHPLAKFGYRRPPFWLWRFSPRVFVFVAALGDLWLIVTGRCSLHRAWQAGHDDGHLEEVARRLRGGR